MDKRYQVFISSTFTDLRNEQQAALRAVLELDQMPAGMELFAAGDDSAWHLIQDVIDGSDYYVLIVGGRYGSLDAEGIGFTEKEYDHAVQRGIPIIPILHRDPETLPRAKTETNEAAWTKLGQFRAKVEQRHTCVFWQTADEIEGAADHWPHSRDEASPGHGVGPGRPGTVRGQTQGSAEGQGASRGAGGTVEYGAVQSAAGTDLRQGEDTLDIRVAFTARLHGVNWGGDEYTAAIQPTWNEIFAGVAPKLIGEASDASLRASLRQFLSHFTRDVYGGQKQFADKALVDCRFSDIDVDTCIVQLRALGLIEESQRKRSVRDTDKYWMLTPYGDGQMARLRALRRTPVAPRRGRVKALKEVGTQ